MDDKLKDCIFYSGGAAGADTLWKQSVEAHGAQCIEYTPAFYDTLPRDITDKIEEQYLEVLSRLQRHFLPISRYAGKLVRRDMIQANKAKTVLAIAHIDKKINLVKGGTGYCTTRAIIRKIPIYVFNQDDNLWYFYDYESSSFLKFNDESYVPFLTNNSTLVGSRELTDAGKEEINKVIAETIKKL